MKRESNMTRDKFEELLAGTLTIILGVILIAIGIAGCDKIWFTVLMSISGATFITLGAIYLEEKKRH